jgi:glutathione reductase (NADPH)
MFNASYTMEKLVEAKHYGFSLENIKFDWANLKASRDAYIARLNKIYESNLDSQKITHIEDHASFEGTPDDPKVRVGSTLYTADNIVIATGGMPNRLKIPGGEHIIDSDGFFELTTQPKKVALIGAGYIAVELAGVFNGLGTDTTLFFREGRTLRSFDIMLSQSVDQSMRKNGVKMVPHSSPKEIVKEKDGTLTMYTLNGDKHEGFDLILSAVGRHPNVKGLNLEKAGVQLDRQGFIAVDDWQVTTAPGKNIYAVGDVIAFPQLTPVAIATGRRLADRLFGGLPNARMDFDMVPTVVFSHPPIGTCGITEEKALCKYGADNIKIYNSSFVNLWYGPFYGGGVGDKPVTKYKLITLLPDEKVIGLHCIGDGSFLS